MSEYHDHTVNDDRALVRSVWPEWKLQGTIGYGRFGTVYRAKRESFAGDNLAAIKIIRIHQDSGERGYDAQQMDAYHSSVARNYVREIQLMESLKGYSNLVTIEDYHVCKNDNGEPWHILIRMELLTPLLEALEGRPFDEGNTIRLGKELCEALEVCGKRQIVHRDIKPQNIFMNTDGVYKLGDFGVARQIDHLTWQTTTGTLSYMAPEVYRGTLKETDFQKAHLADLYSLGMVLYWLSNGRRLPFEKQGGLITADEIEKAFQRKMEGDPLPPPCEAGEKLRKVILKACAFEPKERYQTAAEMKEALNDIERETKEEDRANSDPRRVLIWGLGMLLLAGGVFLAAKILPFPPVPTPSPTPIHTETPTPKPTETRTLKSSTIVKMTFTPIPTPSITAEGLRFDDEMSIVQGRCHLAWQDSAEAGPYTVEIEYRDACLTSPLFLNAAGEKGVTAIPEKGTIITCLVPGKGYRIHVRDQEGGEIVQSVQMPEAETFEDGSLKASSIRGIGIKLRGRDEMDNALYPKEFVSGKMTADMKEKGWQYGLWYRIDMPELKEKRNYFEQIVMRAPNGFAMVVAAEDKEYVNISKTSQGEPRIFIGNEFFNLLLEQNGGIPSGEYAVELYWNGALVNHSTVQVK